MTRKWKLIIVDKGRTQIYEGKEWNIVVASVRRIKKGVLRGFIFDICENYSSLSDDELIKKFGNEIVLRVHNWAYMVEWNEECDRK